MSNTKIITSYNHKGGVGKSSFNMHLGLFLASKNFNSEPKHVLMIDADPQSNLTSRLYKPNHDNYTLGDLILNSDTIKLEDAIVKAPIEKYPTLDILPANRQMKFLEELLITKGKEEKELVVANWLIDNIETVKKYDYIIWDISPSLSTFGRNILNTVDSIIFITEYNNIDSLEAIPLYIDELKESKEELGMPMPNYAIVTNKYKKGKSSDFKIYKDFENCFKNLKPYMINSKMIESSVFKNSTLFQEDIVEYTNNKKLNDTAMNLFLGIIKELEERKMI